MYSYEINIIDDGYGFHFECRCRLDGCKQCEYEFNLTRSDFE